MVAIGLALMFLGTASAHAQSTLVQMRAELLSGWLVTVEGENRTRTLRILGVEQKDAGKFLLEAVYGWTDGNQTAVKAEINQTDLERKLFVTTQPGSKIAATQGPDGSFAGTFTSVNGQVKGLMLDKLSGAELLKAATRINAAPAIEMPAGNVPVACAPFAGGWTGNWGFGQRSLWVVGIDAECKAKYSYSPKTREFKVADIANGVLSFPCGATGGTCYFENHGDDLWGRYSGLDGTNNSIFKKVR